MLAIIVIAFLLLVAAALAISIWRRLPNQITQTEVPPSRSGGLFEAQPIDPTTMKNGKRGARRRAELVERAGRTDLKTLSEAHQTGDKILYDEVLNTLIDSAYQPQLVREVASLISSSDELRANKRLARSLIEQWKAAPGRRSTSEMLHIAALSDDAGVYQQAVEEVIELRERGQLSVFDSDELIDLLVSQYWLLAPDARSGGAGFALKRKLAGVRRKLAAATPVH